MSCRSAAAAVGEPWAAGYVDLSDSETDLTKAAAEKTASADRSEGIAVEEGKVVAV